jgi:hypothetical protein
LLAEIYAESPVFARMREISVDTLEKCSGCELKDERRPRCIFMQNGAPWGLDGRLTEGVLVA